MSKQGFLTPLRVESVDAKTWKLLEDLVWVGSKEDVFTVTAGNYTDFATVPWWTQSLIPRTGTWTKAAVVHDKMCEELNEFHRLKVDWSDELDDFLWDHEPVFNAVDTDAIFRKIARDDRTGRIRSEMLWLGVRLGALRNPARRERWLSTFPRFLGDLVAIMALLSGVFFALRWIISMIS